MLRSVLLVTVASLLLAAEAVSQTFIVSGAFEYEDKGWGYSGWTGVYPARPVRRADVTVLDDGSGVVLGSGSTAQDGSFAIPCSSVGPADVVVRLDADTGNAPAFQRIRVTTEGGVEYSAFSPVVAGHDTTQDLDVGTTTVLRTTSGGDEANPFNMLDMGVDAWEYITGPAGGAPLGNVVRIYWPGGSGSYASGSGAHMAQDDGYDDAVILHELGHVVHNLYSDSDSPGGSHYFGDSDQDPRLSMGEGWATGFAGAVMDVQQGRQAIYLDASGSASSGGAQLRLRLETASPYAGDCYGGADEVAVACTVFDLVDSAASPDQSPGADDDAIGDGTLVGGSSRHEAHWQAFTGPVAAAANLTVNDLWNGWFAVHGADGLHDALRELFALRRLEFSNDPDEPNDAHAEAVPLAMDGGWITNRTLYAGTGEPPAPGEGDKDWYEVQLVKGSEIEIETRYPGAVSDADSQVDTIVELYDLDVVKHAAEEGGGTGRNGKISGFVVPSTGAWRFRIRTTSSIRTYGRYDFRALHLFENFRPQISAGPEAAEDPIPSGDATVLSASASDDNAGQQLSWTWTPLTGGTVVGSGPSVTFLAPTVSATTSFDVQLVVSDELGAESDPALVSITVEAPPSVGGHVGARPWPGGPPGPLGTPTVGGSLGSGGGLLDVSLQGLDVPVHGALLVLGGGVREGRAPRLVGERGAPVGPRPDAVLPLAPLPGGGVGTRVALPPALLAAPVVYLQVVGRDGNGPTWSDLMEVAIPTGP